MLLDALIVALSFVTAWYIKFYSGWLQHFGHKPFEAYRGAMLFGIVTFLVTNWITGLYRPMRAKSVFAESYAVGKSVVLGMFVLMAALYFTKMQEFSRDVLVLFAVAFAVLTLIERISIRMMLRNMRKRGFNQKHILIVGWNQAAERFVHTLEQQPWFGYRILGCVATHRTDEPSRFGVANIGSLDNLDAVLHQHVGVDQVVISLPRGEFSPISQVIAQCEAAGVQSLILPDYFDLLPARPRFETFGEIPLIDTRYVPLDDAVNASIKRVFDVVFSVFVLTVLSPLYLVLAIGIKLSSPGPIVFVQERVGKNRRPFKMYKFRTMFMPEGAPTLDFSGLIMSKDDLAKRVLDDDAFEEFEADWTTPNHHRRTRFGALLRRMSLDELPQFWNVLLGHMSVIGPRPERPYFVEQFKEEIPRYMVKHRVRPGITGWAQVHGWRGDTSITDRIQYDIEYIENWSFWMDIRIVLRTIREGFVHENAY